jgi:IS5 family transposase
MEEALIEVVALRRCAGIELISERIPDESTILTFRQLLDKQELGQAIFDIVKAHIAAREMTMRLAINVDATLIAALSSTKNKEGMRDPVMHQPKKGNQWHSPFANGCAYSMNVYAGLDKDSGLIHPWWSRPPMFTTSPRLLIYCMVMRRSSTGMRAIRAAKRPEMTGKTTESRVAMRPGQRQALPDTPEGMLQDLIEAAQVHIRSKVEHPFRVIKQQFGSQKTRLRGLDKNRCKIE